MFKWLLPREHLNRDLQGIVEKIERRGQQYVLSRDNVEM